MQRKSESQPSHREERLARIRHMYFQLFALMDVLACSSSLLLLYFAFLVCVVPSFTLTVLITPSMGVLVYPSFTLVYPGLTTAWRLWVSQQTSPASAVLRDPIWGRSDIGERMNPGQASACSIEERQLDFRSISESNRISSASEACIALASPIIAPGCPTWCTPAPVYTVSSLRVLTSEVLGLVA